MSRFLHPQAGVFQRDGEPDGGVSKCRDSQHLLTPRSIQERSSRAVHAELSAYPDASVEMRPFTLSESSLSSAICVPIFSHAYITVV
jgi:hypothetical protein